MSEKSLFERGKAYIIKGRHYLRRLSVELTNNKPVVSCVECSEEIIEGARKCRHCGAYQRRSHRWSGVVVTILSLLVAVISLVLGGIDQFRDLIHPQTPLFAVIEPADTDEQFLMSDNEVSLLVQNESDDSVAIENMMCFRSFTADEEDARFLDAIWMDDDSSIISPGSQTRYPVFWMGSGEVIGPDDQRFNAPLPRDTRTARRWSSSCGSCPNRDMNETIDIPITMCRLYFRTSRNTAEIYDFPAPHIDGAMGRMIDDWGEPPTEDSSPGPRYENQPF